MNKDEFSLFIDRLSIAFALQANQIRVLQNLLTARGVNEKEMVDLGNTVRTQFYAKDVRFFRRHLLGHFPGQKRTPEEEQRMLNEWMNLGKETSGPPEESEDSGHSPSGQDT